MKRKLLFAAALLVGALGFNANAQEDVTTKYIKNADFSQGTPVSVGVCTYDYDEPKNYTTFSGLNEVDSWTPSTLKANSMAGGLIPSNVWCGGAGYSVGCTNTGDADGNLLGVIAVWSAKAQYTQETEEALPAGDYTLVVPVYNAVGGTKAIGTNLIGVQGTYAKTTQYAVNKWTYEYIQFSVATESKITISLGYTAANAGSGDMPHLFIGGIKLLKGKVSQSQYEIDSRKQYAEAIRDGEAYGYITGVERKTLIDANVIEPLVNYTNGGDYASVKNAFENAAATFVANQYAYYAFVKEAIKAEALGMKNTSEYAPNATSTAATVIDNVKALKVAEYGFVKDAFPYGVELGDWKSEGSTGTMTGQHWSGDGSRKYLEQSGDAYNAASWNLKYSQDLNLPQGNYVFKVAGRKAANGNVALSLDVTKADGTVLGLVTDFPEGDQGLGINKEGVTSFDATDPAGFANNNNGRGWEWRYVKFSLDTDATVTVAVKGQGWEVKKWVGFCDATVETDNEAVASLVAYNEALKVAKEVIESNDYESVTGTDRTDLQAAIDADGTLDKTSKDDVEKATAKLNELVAAFKAVPALFATYKTTVEAVKDIEELPYASAEALDAFNAAKETAPNSGNEAKEKTAAIRKYVESNAKAEGVEGATPIDVTDANMESGYDSETHKFGVWQVFGQTDGTINLYDYESFTDGDGKDNYQYADISKNDNNAGIKQTVSLEPGKYILTVTARAQATAEAAFRVFAGSTKMDIPRIGSQGGVFGRGWNDVTVEFNVESKQDVEIGVQSGNGRSLWWSATRFRLTRLGDADYEVEVTDAGYATYVAPVDLTFDGKAYVIKNIKDGVAALESVDAASAGTPVIIKGEGPHTFTPAESAGAVNGNLLKVSEGEVTAADNIYVLANIDNQVGFYQLDDEYTLAAGKVYLKVPADEAAGVKFISFDNGTTTAIKAVENASAENAVIYNLAGQRVANPAKGIYIVNGKKVLVK